MDLMRRSNLERLFHEDKVGGRLAVAGKDAARLELRGRLLRIQGLKFGIYGPGFKLYG